MLSRRWIINYVLIVFICLFSWIGTRYDLQTGEKKSTGQAVVEPIEIVRFAIETADESVELRLGESGWQIESPIHWPANQVNVERILSIIDAETESKIAASEIDLNEFGLQFPRAIMQLNDTRVAFGSTNNIGKRRYTMIGSTVYLLPDIYHPFVAQGLPALIDRRLLPNQRLQTLRLPELVVTRNGDQGWTAGNDRPIDNSKLEFLVGNWQELEASRIKRYDSSATPRQKIIAEFENGDRLEYFLMSISPEIVIAHPRLGIQYHFSDDRYYQLVSLRDETS